MNFSSGSKSVSPLTLNMIVPARLAGREDEVAGLEPRSRPAPSPSRRRSRNGTVTVFPLAAESVTVIVASTVPVFPSTTVALLIEADRHLVVVVVDRRRRGRGRDRRVGRSGERDGERLVVLVERVLADRHDERLRVRVAGRPRQVTALGVVVLGRPRGGGAVRRRVVDGDGARRLPVIATVYDALSAPSRSALAR